jgi:16S rRNA (guanine966-N2)-methyltransferase
MRIVGGSLRGRKLLTPEGQAIRPTSDRVRESVFNILAHGIAGFGFDGVRVVDLFAGTGALGLEALSRGASFCLFVDNSTAARGLIRGNADALGLTGRTRLFRRDATVLGQSSASAFGLAFLDPPYGKGLAEVALSELRDGGWLTADAILVVEESEGALRDVPVGYELIDRRTYRDTEVTFLRHSAAPGPTL